MPFVIGGASIAETLRPAHSRSDLDLDHQTVFGDELSRLPHNARHAFDGRSKAVCGGCNPESIMDRRGDRQPSLGRGYGGDMQDIGTASLRRKVFDAARACASGNGLWPAERAVNNAVEHRLCDCVVEPLMKDGYVCRWRA